MINSNIKREGEIDGFMPGWQVERIKIGKYRAWEYILPSNRHKLFTICEHSRKWDNSEAISCYKCDEQAGLTEAQIRINEVYDALIKYVRKGKAEGTVMEDLAKCVIACCDRIEEISKRK